MSEKRFSFGKNWSSILNTLNEQRIVEAEISLKSMLHVENLNGKTFLDIGSGSSLFSLAAARLGAKKIILSIMTCTADTCLGTTGLNIRKNVECQ